MNSDEEYLDDLLKSIMEGEESEESMFSADTEMSEVMNMADEVSADEMSADELADLVNAVGGADVLDDFAIEDFGVMEPEAGELQEEETDASAETFSMDTDFALDDFAIEDFGVMEPEPEQEQEMEMAEEENADLEDFADLAIHDFGEEEMVEEIGEMPETGEEAEEELISVDEIDAMFAAADAVATDNAEEAPAGSEEDEMLALLEGMSTEASQTEDDFLAGFGEENLSSAGQETQSVEENASAVKAKEKKSGRSGLFKGKKKQGKNAKADAQEAIENENTEENAGVPKKQSFFSKMITFLTEADDEDELNGEGMTPSDENKNILIELDEEDKKKKKKKVKGKKGKNEEENLDEENEDGEEVKEKKEKKKKKKDKKKDKAMAAEVSELLDESKPEKKVSKKNIAVIAALGITVAIMIVVLCSIVPGFFDKREARDAFYRSDYSKSYELLYGKKLDNSDTIIYNKCKIILELNRKLDAYHNYMGIGKEVQALDALMSGVQKYPEILVEAEEYHVTQEVEAIYETILNILNDKYHISEQVAKVIISYDDLTYTRKLESIVNGTPFVNPEAEVWTNTEDVLPEEQAIMEDTFSDSEADAESASEEEFPAGEATEDAVASMTGDAAETMTEVNDAAATDEEITETENADGESTGTEEAAEVETEAPAAVESTATSSGEQGELIQGVKQPISFEVHGQ